MKQVLLAYLFHNILIFNIFIHIKNSCKGETNIPPLIQRMNPSTSRMDQKEIKIKRRYVDKSEIGYQGFSTATSLQE